MKTDFPEFGSGVPDLGVPGEVDYRSGDSNFCRRNPRNHTRNYFGYHSEWVGIMAKPQDKFPLIELRRLIRELYFKFDELTDEQFDALVDDINNSAAVMRDVALERRNERANSPGPPIDTPQG